jgi:hypothetical protein
LGDGGGWKASNFKKGFDRWAGPNNTCYGKGCFTRRLASGIPTEWIMNFLVFPRVLPFRWHMNTVEQAYNQVRSELAEVGLLSDGLYLDCIELCVSDYPCTDELGYLFEDVGPFGRLGFKPGVIYLPSDLSYHSRRQGHSILDTIRHEYAHAWSYVDPRFIRDEWFSSAFGATYSNENPKPYRHWRRRTKTSRTYQKALRRCRTEAGKQRLWMRHLRREFISDYAVTNACEDFAETFMFFLKYRNSLDRFDNRPGVLRKIRSIERAVQRASRQLRWGQQKHWRIASA